MSWVNELIDLYEINSDKIGVIEYRGEMPYVLLPPFHTTVTAQITVTIDQDGNFMNAEPVDLNDKLTIIPVTEKSGSRTAGKEPHPLCDNLRYLAGDYTKYYKDDGICHELYISQLKEWVESEYCHEKVRAIYLYLKKNTLISDLVDKKIIKLDEQNQIDDKENIQGIVQTKAFVRFIIRLSNSDLFELKTDECWKDRTLQDCYINYVRSREKEKGLCYLTGNMEAISYLHSKKIRNEGDGAKLISSNDSQNFTYRGRFVSKEEAFAVGNETSQKIHNALKWIIRKQGTFFDTLAVVTWESNRLCMPTYKDRKNWERVLTLACSLVKKDRKMEEWNVALDKNQKDRNYLYGRLLAVADRIEYRTYDDGDKARVTNAKRYMSTFSQRPFETWKVIEENIQPYMNKLGIAERRFYENLLNDIYELFEIDSFKDNKKLDGLYLLGFHSQAYDLKLKMKKEDSKEKEEEE